MSQHWDDLYRHGTSSGLSWYEVVPATIPLLIKIANDPHDRIVDVGAGSSTLIDHLIQLGYSDLTLVDLSPVALDDVQDRIGDVSANVSYVEADIRTWRPAQRFDVWHDRATFHFMATAEDRAAYRTTLDSSLAASGRAVIAAFAHAGPDHCAGLPVARYDGEELAAEFADLLDCIECFDKVADASDTDSRPYVVCSFSRTGTTAGSPV